MHLLQEELVNLNGRDADIEKAVLEALWPSTVDDDRFDRQDWVPCLTYYVNQYGHGLQNQGQHVAVRKHAHIVDLCKLLLQDIPREQIRTLLLDRSMGYSVASTEVADNTIDLTPRICFMVNVGTSAATINPGRTQLQWKSDTLSAFLRNHFTHQMELCGTDNLADHQRMLDPDDKSIEIFHHASFLARQQQHQDNLYPTDLVEETQRTLILLFPQHDHAQQRWLQSQRKRYTIDHQLASNGQLRLDERQLKSFRFWHDRLAILKQAYDEARLATLSQWWYDRRNGVQWYTFWVAVCVFLLTVFFGMVQSIEGALQVSKAYHPTVV
ncbi:hypothetical protein EK21DRAFT_106832 [Setomelanomma holmii]|uniref:Uncharacterized protein n=1 Tax=Setomelanomma holmii TaxID=210430 RepID=A0A9P4HKE8_9PLEO|nr:hypothetical protein EK21DRAFT_106832 [Setomelanomma holmii]